MALDFQSCACRSCGAVAACEHKRAVTAFVCPTCGHSWRQVVEVVIEVHRTTLPLQLSPQKEPFVHRLCVCWAVRHL